VKFLGREFTHFRRIVIDGFSEPDYAATQTAPDEEEVELFKVPSGTNSVFWLAVFRDGDGVATAGTCSIYFYEKDNILSHDDVSFLISRSTETANFGPVTIETPIYESRGYGARVSSIVSAQGVTLDLYARIADFDEE
jgi:hypothetical protein